MLHHLHLGDRVRLTDHAAKTFGDNPRRNQSLVDWKQRRGTITRISMVSDDVTIKWDGRVSLDHWPHRALQCVEGSPPA